MCLRLSQTWMRAAAMAALSFLFLGVTGVARAQHLQQIYMQMAQARQFQQHNLHLRQAQQRQTAQQQTALVQQYHELQRPLLRQYQRGQGTNSASSATSGYTQSNTVTMESINARGKLTAKTVDLSTNFAYTWHKHAAAKAAALAAQGQTPKWVQVSKVSTKRNASGAPLTSSVTVDVTSNFAAPKHYFFHVRLDDGFLQNGIDQELNRLDSLYGLGPYRPAVAEALKNLRQAFLPPPGA